MPKLKRELSLFTATLYGVGIILGAGIYVLIGEAAGIAGNAIWMSFAVAAAIAAFTGLSYAELAGMFPRDAAEYVYTKNAFKRNYLSFIVQWIMIFTLLVSGSTVALGFGGYFSHLFGSTPLMAAIGLIIILSAISYIGIKQSSRFTVFSTIIETAGLVIVILVGIFFIGKADIDYFAFTGGFNSVLAATALIFFAYIGFEELVNMSEETKNASKVIPKALVMALLISTVLYILVALSSISILGAENLAQSGAPLTDVVATAIPQAGLLMSVIALFATGNTVLVILIVISRMIYGLSRNNIFPTPFGAVGKRRTPYVAVFTVMVLSIAFLFIGGIKTIALLTDVGIFIVYLFVNASLIWLRYRQPNIKRSFRTPLNIGKLPVLAVLGIASSFFMLMQFDPVLILYEIAVVIIGFGVYKASVSMKKHREKAEAALFRKSVFTSSEIEALKSSVTYSMKVSFIMARDVKVVKASDRVSKAVSMMSRTGINSVVVVDGSRVAGIITERDLLNRVMSRNIKPQSIKCSQIMSKPVIRIAAENSVENAIRIMEKRHIKKLPVEHDGKLVGIITAMDILESGHRIPYSSLKKLRRFYPVQKRD